MKRLMIVLCVVAMVGLASTAAQASVFDAPGFTYAKVVDGGAFVNSGAAFSPDGTKIAYVERDNTAGVRRLQLRDRATNTTTTVTTWAQASGTLTPPYFSADGTKIGWTRSNSAIANDLMVYTISSGTTTTYTGPTTGTADAANSDFLGSSTDQWTAWAYGPAGGADLFTYSANGSNWVQGTNLTSTTTLNEYEPDSNRAGDKILYWSGETAGEPMDTTHTLTNVAGVWTKDVGFSPITGSTWAFWSGDETKIGVSKYDTDTGYGMGDLYVYNASGNFLFDLTGPSVGQNSNWQFFGFNFNVGNDYLFTSNAANTQGGRDIWIATAAVPAGTAVPEPSTIIVWGLLGLVGAGFGLWRRKRAV